MGDRAWSATAAGELLGNIRSKLKCLLSEEADNLLTLVCRFTVWTVSKKSHESRLRQMCFNVF